MSTDTARQQVFRLPDLGEGLAEAEVLRWRVAVGDRVEVDQIVVEVETAKAAVEVPVPFAGRVARLHCEAGAVVDVGAPLISVDGGDPDAPAGSGSVLVGYGTGPEPAPRPRARIAGPLNAGLQNTVSHSAVSQGAAPPTTVSQDPVTAPGNPPPAPRVISPVVRGLARANGIDLRTLTPSGPDGVIRRRDVAAAIDRTTEHSPVERPPIERVPLQGRRRAVAEKLARSRAEIPDATTWVDADATELVNARLALRAAFPDRPIGLLALLGRICVAALARFPDLNASVDAERGEIVRFPHVNLGFAAQTERGLVVPVVRDAHRLTTARLQAETARLTGLAREGRLQGPDLTGGTFTLNNYGVFGVDGSTPIINHPEAAILGIGRVTDKPWVVDGGLAVRKVTQLSLTFDHRVCDGGVAGGFLRFVADCVERPAVLLADL